MPVPGIGRGPPQTHPEGLANPALAHAEVIRCVADATLIADERTVPRVSIPEA